MTLRTVASLLFVTALGTAGPAVPAEFCVTCASPDASYRCEVTGTGEDPRAWLQCITDLAKQGGHESCSVDRKAPQPCAGVHKVLSAPDGPPPALPAEAQRVPAPASIAPPSNATGAAPPRGPGPMETAPVEGEPPKRVPQTMQELAADTYEASKQGIKNAGESVEGTAKKAGDGLSKAGEAVGDAVKKSWRCVTSLFGDC